jgi:hypothetical protein
MSESEGVRQPRSHAYGDSSGDASLDPYGDVADEALEDDDEFADSGGYEAETPNSAAWQTMDIDAGQVGRARRGQRDARGRAGAAAGFNGFPGSGHREAELETDTENAVKIGLWGSPQSGKTTYLGSLRHAVASQTDCGTWGIFPVNDLSRDLLIDWTNDLTLGRFPEGTLPGTKFQLRWLFVGELAGSRFAPRRHWPRRAGSVPGRFTLDLIDVSGKAFGYDPTKEVDPDVAEAALKHLTAADGLIYLFDPLRERSAGDATNYVNRTVGELRSRLGKTVTGPHMEHHVAVCITKFDNKAVFNAAREHGLVKLGDDGMPRVPDDRAEEFFDLMCTGKFWDDKHEQGDRSAYFVRNELRNAFGDKIEYFVTSSIGFKRQPGWSGSISDFDPDDFANVRQTEDDEQGILGTIRPINVLEPLIRLQQRIQRLHHGPERS